MVGLEVPEILLRVREGLYETDALHTEGIFRKAGKESDMGPLRQNLNSGLPISSFDPHSIATVLKVT